MTLIRRLVLSLALIAGIAPAMAQVPAPVPALPDAERRTSYSISASTCSCNVNFALFGDGTDYQNWVEVFLNGTRVNFNDATFGWVIAPASGSFSSLARPITNAVLTFNSAQTGTVQIVGARRPRRTAQFAENAGVPARNLNQALTDIISQNREIWDKTNDVTGRALLSQPGNAMGPLPLPSVCSGALLGFDASGLNPLCLSSGGAGNVILPTIAGNLACFTDTAGRLQNCTGLSLALSQNAATAAFISNVNPGINALAVWSATNANGSASFGVGGANYTATPILQNRAYVAAQPALDGIAINAQGADPIVFGISNTEVGRWTGTGGLTLAPNYQSGNIANAALFASVPNRTLGLVPTYNGFYFSQGAPITAIKQGGQDLLGLQQTLVASNSLAAGDSKAGVAIAGYSEANCADPCNTVAIFGQSQANVAGGSISTANIVAQNIADNNALGLDANFFQTLELNPDKWKNVGGTNTTVNGNHFYALNCQGGGNHTDEIGSCIVINNSAFPATTRWANGIELVAGCCITGVSIGPAALGNNQGSQQLAFLSKDAGGTARAAAIFSDPNGSLYPIQAPNAALIFEDGNLTVLGQFQSTSVIGGNTGFQLNQATSGVLKTNSTGVVSSSLTLPSGLSTSNFTVVGSLTATGLIANSNLVNAATTVNGQTCTLGSTCTVAAAPTGAAGGDLAGTYPNPTIFNITTGATVAGTLLHTNIAAPGTPASGKDIVWTDSTDLRLHDKNASGVIGTTVVADTGAANNYISAISAAGAITKSRPACATLSDAGAFCAGTSASSLTGTLQAAQEPAHTGDVTNSAGSLALAIGATKVTSAMLNSDVFSTAHTWAGQQTFAAPVLGTPASGVATNLTGLPVSTGLTGTGTGVATALGTNVGTAGAFVVNGGALGTPSSGVGTNITNVNAATLNAATFAAPGAIGGGTPSTGAFTTVTASTSMTSPLNIGGSAASSTFTMESTSGAGTTDAIVGLTGSQVERFRVTTGGFFNIGPNVAPDALLTVNGNTAATVAPGSGALLHLVGANAAVPRIIVDAFGSPNVFLPRYADGTLASKTAAAAGALTFAFANSTWDGSAYAVNSEIDFQTLNAQTPTDHSSRIVLSTTPPGSILQTSAVIITPNGGIGVNTNSDPGSGMIYTNAATFMTRTKTSWNTGAAAAAGTLTNAPAAGPPTKWIPVDDNGTTRYIPAW